ncbi:Protein of unknown function [Gryllus bimaculatus]|nr:Protein of unknown function [Gryllus bimaculatus]
MIPRGCLHCAIDGRRSLLHKPRLERLPNGLDNRKIIAPRPPIERQLPARPRYFDQSLALKNELDRRLFTGGAFVKKEDRSPQIFPLHSGTSASGELTFETLSTFDHLRHLGHQKLAPPTALIRNLN